ncbi:ion channel [Microbacterium sp. NPDC090225]|uniref:ion channel n=1 Tax=Microbacterium sp. NPDC090225 TaxID=3364207 RepID=UPI003823FEB6
MNAVADPPGPRPRARRPAHRDRHGAAGYVGALALLILSYALCSAQRTTDPSPVAFLAILATVAVVFRVTAVRSSIQHVSWGILALAAAAAIVTSAIGATGRLLDIAFSGASILALLIAPAAIVAHQARRRGFNLEALLATITAYVLVGLLFTFVYNLTSLVSPAPLFGDAAADSLADQLFFSFTTLTTTGYGNLAPATTTGQTIAVTEAITGQLFLITAVARIMQGTGRRNAAQTSARPLAEDAS